MGLRFLGSHGELRFSSWVCDQLLTWPTDQPRHATKRLNLPDRNQIAPIGPSRSIIAAYTGKIRNPKLEIRNKHENPGKIRNPKLEIRSKHEKSKHETSENAAA